MRSQGAHITVEVRRQWPVLAKGQPAGPRVSWHMFSSSGGKRQFQKRRNAHFMFYSQNIATRRGWRYSI